MTNQFIVAVLADATLVVRAVGPFRSDAKAQRVCDQINDASEWSDSAEWDGATICAQVVALEPVRGMLASVALPGVDDD